MNAGHTKETLIAFEREIADLFNAGKIRAPIHLDGNNETFLINYFRERVREEDWICCSWRSHYKVLLKGVPPEEVRAAILAGRSITLTFPEHRVISSAIVGGVLPIAVGLAMAEEMKSAVDPSQTARVHVFVGDMTARTGAYHEAITYAIGHRLPMSFVTEDNGRSVVTPTREVWGSPSYVPILVHEETHVYELPWPHAGAGVRVQF